MSKTKQDMVYRFRSGSRFTGDATAVAEELEVLRQERGTLDPPDVVEQAEDEGSALHPHFPWDDAEAAYQHRLDIARRLIRAIVVVRDNTEPVSRYVHVPANGYEPLTTIISKPDAYMQALREAQADLDSAHRRVSELLDVAKRRKASKDSIARIMLAAQALATANEALHQVN